MALTSSLSFQFQFQP